MCSSWFVLILDVILLLAAFIETNSKEDLIPYVEFILGLIFYIISGVMIREMSIMVFI